MLLILAGMVTTGASLALIGGTVSGLWAAGAAEPDTGGKSVHFAARPASFRVVFVRGPSSQSSPLPPEAWRGTLPELCAALGPDEAARIALPGGTLFALPPALPGHDVPVARHLADGAPAVAATWERITATAALYVIEENAVLSRTIASACAHFEGEALRPWRALQQHPSPATLMEALSVRGVQIPAALEATRIRIPAPRAACPLAA